MNINELKILLANKATEMLHGEQEAENSEETAKQTFTDNSLLGENLPSISNKPKTTRKIKMTLYRFNSFVKIRKFKK